MNEENLASSVELAGNTRRATNGIYSRRLRSDAEAAMVADLMSYPHVHELDRLAAEQIAREQAFVDALRNEMDRVGLAGASTARLETLGTLHSKAESRLLRAMREFGATPKSRAEFARDLAEGDHFAAGAARRRARRADADTTAEETP